MKQIQYYDLTPGQLLIKYGETYAPKGVHNLGSRIDIRSEIDEGLLRQAITIATYRIPSLNLHIVKSGKKGFEQYVSEEAPKVIDFVDVSDWSEEEISKQLVKWCGAPFSDDLNDVQLYQIRLLRTEWGHIIFIKVHHSLLDAFGIMMLVSYIDSVYDALVKGKPLPEQLPSPEKMIEKEIQYYNSKRYESDKAWFENMFSEGFEFRPLVFSGKQTLRAKLSNPMTSKGGFTNIIIPRELVMRLNEKAEEYKVSPGVFYMLALRTFIAAKSDSEDVVFNTIMARRSTLLQKKSGCSIANALPFRTKIDGTTVFGDAVHCLSISLQELYKHSSFPCEDAFAMLGKSSKSGTITAADPASITYQPYFKFGDTSLEYTVERVSPGKSMSRFYLSIMPYDNTGNMYGNYEFFLDAYSYEDISYFHSFMLKFVEAGIQNPEKTIDQLVSECM